jgi:hypothetical protein
MRNRPLSVLVLLVAILATSAYRSARTTLTTIDAVPSGQYGDSESVHIGYADEGEYVGEYDDYVDLYARDENGSPMQWPGQPTIAIDAAGIGNVDSMDCSLDSGTRCRVVLAPHSGWYEHQSSATATYGSVQVGFYICKNYYGTACQAKP